MGLGTGVYLRSAEIRGFTLLVHLTPPEAPWRPLGSHFPSQRGGCCCSGKLQREVTLIRTEPPLVVTGLDCPQPQSLGIPRCSPPSTFLILRAFPHCQDLSSSRGVYLLLSWPLPFVQDHMFFSGALIFQHSLFSPEPPAPIFPSQNSLSVQKHDVRLAS